jgi:monovalent cation:proton antiporter-2 (CPA2) family protein
MKDAGKQLGRIWLLTVALLSLFANSAAFVTRSQVSNTRPVFYPTHVIRTDVSTSKQISRNFRSFQKSADGSILDVEFERQSAEENEGKVRRQNFRLRARRWIHQAWNWQRKTRRSLLTAAALCLMLIVSGSQVLDATSPSVQATSSAAEIQRIVPSSKATSTTAVESKSTTAVESKSTTAVESNSATAVESQLVSITRGGSVAKASPVKTLEASIEEGARKTSRTLIDAVDDLSRYMAGPKSDTLILLLATALITPLCKKLGTSPILGFLAAGMLLGPNGAGLITGVHSTETLAELGIVFFLFEMGVELSFERLVSMRKDVFGLGFSQFVTTALAFAAVGKLFGLPANALVVLGGGLALSSSAFVLQLLKDKNQLATRFGKATFGVLLFQDLAVVPLLVVTPILAGSGAGLAAALGSAILKASLALGSIAFAGRVVLNPLFKTVAGAQSQEAFLGVILLTVLSLSFLTEGLGLSNTLGAFLAGVLLSETKYRYQVEADIAPFRGILLGLFFVTVGFEIDVGLILSNVPLVASIVFGIIGIKALVTTCLSLCFGLSLSTSEQTGLILAQGGEFAFVAFGLARSLGILDSKMTKLMLTCVSLTMALTPMLSVVGANVAKRLEEKSDFTNYLGQDRDANEIKASDDFVVVVGYGVVGKVVCDLLNEKFIKYVGLDINPNKAIQARNLGLPVYYGDIGRQEVADAFNAGKAKCIIVCIADRAQATRVVIALRRWYPDVNIFARAADADHASRLQNTLNVAAMVPILPEDNILLTLPFGGAVMRTLGVSSEEVDAIIENKRKTVLSGRGLRQNEEELALLQLGIAADDDEEETGGSANSMRSAAVLDDDDDDEDEDGDDERADRVEAAAERREEARLKSPFVAKVIEEACPDSISSDGEETSSGEFSADLDSSDTQEAQSERESSFQ